MNSTAHPSSDRLAYLDALRGVAILMVVLFHTYARWPDRMPFGGAYVNSPLKYGYIGVQLFFLISGFVIFLTLDKSGGFGDFIRRRWLRLVPAMIIASAIIWLMAPLMPERPAGTIKPIDLLPGLTFIEPYWWAKLLHRPVDSIEAAFWSLYVEVKFYFFVGAVFFGVGRRYVIGALSLAFAGALFVQMQLSACTSGVWACNLANSIAVQSSAIHFSWFAAGCCFYLSYKEGSRAYFLGGLMLGGVACVLPWRGWGHATAAAAVLVLFASSLVWSPVRRLLCNPLLLTLGFVSYPLYLIHENAMVAFTLKIAAAWPWLTHELMPVLPLLLLVVVAWVLAKYAEQALRARLQALVGR